MIFFLDRLPSLAARIAVLAAVLVLALPAGPLPSPAARAQGARQAAPCDAPLQLTLVPGAHFPDADSVPLPDDMPPGPIVQQVPLYPGATATTEEEPHPEFGVPAVLYLMSASTTYRSDADTGTLSRWYQDAFTACGFTFAGSGTLGQNGVELSSGIDFRRQDGTNQILVDLSFETSPSGGTLILYIAMAITPPAYPVDGSPLRVPGTPVSLQVTEYSAANGTKPLRPVRQATVTDAATAASIADEINHLPKPVVSFISCPSDDGSHDTLVFTDADRSTHVVRVDLQGCRGVAVPPPAPGALFATDLITHLDALLKGSDSHVPYPFDARTLKPASMRQLGSAPARFLGTPSNDSPLLYLSHGDLYTVPAKGGTAHLIAHKVADAAFTVRGNHVLVRPSGADLAHLGLVDLTSGTSTALSLPADAELLGTSAGSGSARLSDATGTFFQYVWMRRGRKIGGVDPEHPAQDTYWSPNFLPAPSTLRLLAISPGGTRLALVERGTGLVIRLVGNVQGRIGPIERQLPATNIRFLSWAPDDTHLAYQQGSTLYSLDAATGATRALLHLGTDVIHAAAWDPWSRVIALATTVAGAPASSSSIRLVNADGSGTGTLPLRGAKGLYWAPWHGTTLGITRSTGKGSQAWTAALPSLPPDPAADMG
jgi:hypothetical protein